MLKPTEQLVKDVDGLKNNAAFRRFVEWIVGSLYDIREKTDIEPEDHRVRWGQGGAQQLTDILKVVGASEEILQRFAKNKVTKPME